jgi:cell division topological specificity factor
MTLFERIFGKKDGNSASTARNRLTLMLATERAACSTPYMDEMKTEILDVVKRYVDDGNVRIKTEQNQNIDILELEIDLKKRDD